MGATTSGLAPAIGIDVVELADIEGIRYKKRFAEYFLTKKEIAHMPAGKRRVEFLASRFALKESVIKAFPYKLKPHDFMIEKKNSQPHVVFALKKYNRAYTVAASITHTKRTAAAVALVTRAGV